MRRPNLLLVLFTLLVAACTDRTPIDPDAPELRVQHQVADLPAHVIVPRQHVIILRSDIGVADVDHEVRRLIGLMDAVQPGSIGLRTFRNSIKGFAVEVPDDDVLQAIMTDGSVRYIAPNVLMESFSTPGIQADPPSWGLDRIDQRDLPLDDTFRYPGTGAGVYAYVIDSGFRFTHDDFGGRAILGEDFHEEPADGVDCHSHGTHVGGTVGGATFGVAKEVMLVAVRVGLPCPSLSMTADQVLAAVDWIASEKVANPARPMVTNASLGTYPRYEPVDEAVSALMGLGVTFVAAAGNGFGGNACSVTPAGVPGVITVASSSTSDRRAGASNIGSCVDIFAPGIDIISAGIAADNATAEKRGTSMAAPHVSGAAAVYLERNPEATPADVRDWLIANATLDRLDDIGAGSPNRLLFLPGEFPVLPIVIDILPGSTVNPINRGSRGTIPVAVLATDDFDPATLVLAGVRLGDEIDDDTPIHRRPNGTFMAGWEDVNGDGRPDLVLHFSVPELVANGDLHAGTTLLVLTGSTSAGVSVRGEDIVQVVP